jgi:hypothetical protein
MFHPAFSSRGLASPAVRQAAAEAHRTESRLRRPVLAHRCRSRPAGPIAQLSWFNRVAGAPPLAREAVVIGPGGGGWGRCALPPRSCLLCSYVAFQLPRGLSSVYARAGNSRGE